MAKKKQEEEKPVEETPSKEKSGGNTLKMILMIGVPIMLIQAGIAWFLISSFAQPTKAVSDTEEPVEEDVTKPGTLYEFSDVIINPAGTAGSRFLNANIVLEFTAPELEAEISEKNVQLRDALVNVLVSKTILELDGSQGRAAIKEELKEACNTVLKKGKVRAIYLPSFIFQ
ncbi:MAG: flagellar basal body-associated FliL family protein [Deferribacteres bacterium]|nr:flagellar basal body-associated FliL family protein [candidate division KSB1 bacterium]MCB9501934.1 flagellar basal body-associated FliL family protein [Deferribacteres bacterium]